MDRVVRSLLRTGAACSRAALPDATLLAAAEAEARAMHAAGLLRPSTVKAGGRRGAQGGRMAEGAQRK